MLCCSLRASETNYLNESFVQCCDESLLCCSLRTSETNYLNESFAFYSAIRMRGYYSKAIKEDR